MSSEMANNIRKYGKKVNDNEYQLFVRYLPKLEISFQNERTEFLVENCKKYVYKNLPTYLVDVKVQRNILKDHKHRSADLKNMGLSERVKMINKIKLSVIEQLRMFHKLFPFDEHVVFYIGNFKIE